MNVACIFNAFQVIGLLAVFVIGPWPSSWPLDLLGLRVPMHFLGFEHYFHHHHFDRLFSSPLIWSTSPIIFTKNDHNFQVIGHLRDRPLTIFVTTWPLRFARADALFRLRALLPSSPIWSNTPSIYTKHLYQYSEKAVGRRKRKGWTRRLCANFASFISKRSTPTFAFLQSHHHRHGTRAVGCNTRQFYTYTALLAQK